MYQTNSLIMIVHTTKKYLNNLLFGATELTFITYIKDDISVKLFPIKARHLTQTEIDLLELEKLKDKLSCTEIDIELLKYKQNTANASAYESFYRTINLLEYRKAIIKKQISFFKERLGEEIDES